MRFVHLVGLLAVGSACGCLVSAPKSVPPPDPAGAGAASASASAAPAPTVVPDAPKNDQGAPVGSTVATAASQSAPSDDPAEGGLGLVGTGKGGGGSGEGTIGLGAVGTTGHGAGAAAGSSGNGKKGRVAAATAMTTGSGLAADVIQRVVRAHVGEIQACYEKAIEKTPALSGKVAVKFVIDGKGAVASASADDTNIADATMVSCVLAAVKRMSFPAPDGGGVMVVTYPFQFAPSD
jgi:hypothetical protein